MSVINPTIINMTSGGGIDNISIMKIIDNARNPLHGGISETDEVYLEADNAIQIIGAKILGV